MAANLPVPPQIVVCARLLRQLNMGMTTIAAELGANKKTLAPVLDEFPGQRYRMPPRSAILKARADSGLGDYRHGPPTDERILALRKLIPADETPFTEAEKARIRAWTREGRSVQRILAILASEDLHPSRAKLRKVTRGCRPRTKLTQHEIHVARRWRAKGMSVEWLAEHFECSPEPIRNATTFGPPRPDLRRHLPQIVAQAAAGLTHDEIGAFWSVSRSMVSKVLGEYRRRSNPQVLAA